MSDRLYRIQNKQGEWVPAWGCSCEEPPNTPMAVVEYDIPILGIEYGFYHVDCIEKLERVEDE